MDTRQGLPKDSEGEFDIESINIEYDDALLPHLGAGDVQSAIDALKASTAGVGGAILNWTTETWSNILAKINAVPADKGVIVMMRAGTFTMDVAANLDRVIFIGMVESPTEQGGTPTTLVITVPLLGSFLYLINVVALTRATLFDGDGPFRVNLMGSSGLSPDYTLPSQPPTIKLNDNGSLKVSASQFSLFGGGNDYTVEMGNNSTIDFILTGSGIIGDKTANLKLGAVAAATTMGVDATCTIAGQNGAFGNAFVGGITLSIDPNGNAFFGPYQATTPANWNGSAPGNIGAALDRIAAKIGPIP